jgi:hypothetical protein
MYPGSRGVRSKGGEKSSQAVVVPDEPLLHGLHGLAGPPLVARAGDDGPGLGNGVDLAFLVFRRSERRPIVEERALVPLPVPCLRVQGCRQISDPTPPACCAITFSAAVGDWSELPQIHQQKPPQPDALPSPFVTDAVHAVVPIAGSDQGETVAAQIEAPVQGSGAVFVQRRPIFRSMGSK